MTDAGTIDGDAPAAGASRPRSPNLAVAKLLAALRTRPGHVVVTGDDEAAVEALFALVEKDLLTWRSVHVSGHGLDPEAVVIDLWGGNVNDQTTLRPRAMMQALVAAARLIERPILVVVTDAHAAGAASLERLRQTLDCAPDANQIVRVALLGDRRLLGILRAREARAVAASIATSVRMPSAGGEWTLADTAIFERRRSGWMWLAVVASVALVGAWLASPRRERPRTSPPVVATPVPPPTVEAPPTRDDMHAEPAAGASEPTPAEPGATLPVAEPVPSPAEPPALGAVPAEPPAPAAATAEPAVRGIALQVGAFRQPEHAEAVRARLASQFPDVHVSPFVHDGTTLYGVRVGRFASEADLALAAAAMRAAGFTPLRVRD